MNDNFTDVMLDIETFGTNNNAPIVQIGAVAFNAHGNNAALWTNSPDALASAGMGIRLNVDLARSRHPGTFDAGAVEWWLKQSDAARQSITAQPRLPLGNALETFARWIHTLNKKTRELHLWSNGPTFDEVILRAAFLRYGKTLPISFRGSRCCRTMFDLATSLGWRKLSAPDDITKHDGLDDAVFQARGVDAMLDYIRVVRTA